MTACQKIKREIVLHAAKYFAGQDLDKMEQAFLTLCEGGVNAGTIDEQYDALCETDAIDDYVSAFRSGYEVETKLPCESSRHYESKSVAMRLSDGSWVGWVYWYGGGKHGEPGAIDWMEDAYDLEVTETEKLVVVREFKKKEPGK